jgi:hypothetical protein
MSLASQLDWQASSFTSWKLQCRKPRKTKLMRYNSIIRKGKIITISVLEGLNLE